MGKIDLNKLYAGIGSRRLDKGALVLCYSIGAFLARLGWTLVTGAAKGADQAFAQGALSEGGEVILCLPWASYERDWVLSARVKGARVRVLKPDDKDAFASVDAHHPAARYLSGSVRKLHARNHLVVHKAKFVMAFPQATEAGGLGGTGQGIRVAQALGIRAVRLDNPVEQRRVRAILRGDNPEDGGPGGGNGGASTPSGPVFTLGLSKHSSERFLERLKQHNVDVVVDVRSTPYSRHVPWFNQRQLKKTLGGAGIAYAFAGKVLGGRPHNQSCYTDGRADYALMAEQPEFKQALAALARASSGRRVALVCSENEPLKCHRALLIGRRLAELGVEVKHIHASGYAEPHKEFEARLLRATGFGAEDLDKAYATQAARVAYKRR
jgi:hypothetical protein